MESLPCVRGSHLDSWTFDVSRGQRVEINVDTVDPTTAADFAVFGLCGGTFVEGHDERPCTFGKFDCPAVSFVAELGGRCFLDVLFDDLFLIDEVSTPPCQSARIAEYRLDVRVEGVFPPLTLAHDSLPPPPVFTELEDVTPCGAGLADSWRFDVVAGDAIVAGLDTADLETAADLAFDVVCNGQLVLVRDDDFPCSFPPPAFKCPLGPFVAPGDGMCLVTIRSLGSCADSRTARYRVGITRNGESAELTLTDDDVARLTSPPEFTDFEDVTPCRAGVFDSWRFDVAAGEIVVVGVDTADPETAADLLLDVTCDNQLVLVAGNELVCTFPPPAFECTLGSFPAAADRTCIVTVHTLGNCTDANTVRYRLGVERDCVSAPLTLSTDDRGAL